VASDDDSDEADSDHALVARARRGDDEAFAALYHRHRDWVVRVAHRITADRDDALDVLQDAFVYLFRKLADPAFVLSATVRGLLHPTVRHLALDRRRRRRPEVDSDELADVLPAPPDPTTHAARALAAAVSALPPAHRQVLVMRFADDLSLQQIADASGVPLGTVKSRLHHALAAVRRALRGE
jgi:RNA polymerase sigma-70 factor (ECF subfamily)